MKLTSKDFVDGSRLDPKFTVEGEDVSPHLSWSEVPSGTKSFALVCEDPDAPSPQRPAKDPWVHWIVFNIPASVNSLPQGIGRQPQPNEVPEARQGKNSWPDDNLGYRGPAPPPGSGKHRYFFKLFALDTILDLSPGATKQQLSRSMSEHVLGEAQLIGTFQR